MNDCLVVYIERDVLCNIDNETIMQRFQNMKICRRQLLTLCIYVFFFLFFFFLLLLLLSSIYDFFFLLDCIIYVF